jgi:tripartite-type tricarboxylate transporter receptor subunit TctC
MSRGTAMPTRRRVLAAWAAGLVLPAAGLSDALAQAVRKPVHIIVGFPAGGGTDVIARILADRLRGSYAATVLVENKPGAAARIAVEYVKNAEADGSVMLFTPDFPITVYPASFRSLNYDPIRDFTPVSPAARSMLTFNVGPGVPADIKTLAAFVHWCRTYPDKAAYATTAAGGTPHFVGVMLANAAATAITPVHYRGGAPAIQDLIGGHVPASVNPISEALPHARSGALRMLAVTGSRRSQFLPDVPTMRAGLRRGGGVLARRVRAGEDAARHRAGAECGDRRGGEVDGDGGEPGEGRQHASVPDAGGIRCHRQGRHRALGPGGEGLRICGGGVGAGNRAAWSVADRPTHFCRTASSRSRHTGCRSTILEPVL